MEIPGVIADVLGHVLYERHDIVVGGFFYLIDALQLPVGRVEDGGDESDLRGSVDWEESASLDLNG